MESLIINQVLPSMASGISVLVALFALYNAFRAVRAFARWAFTSSTPHSLPVGWCWGRPEVAQKNGKRVRHVYAYRPGTGERYGVLVPEYTNPRRLARAIKRAQRSAAVMVRAGQ